MSDHLPDHLLNTSGPARELHPAHSADGDTWPADGADEVSIPTVKYLQGGSHLLQADRALGDDNGLGCRGGSRCGRVQAVLHSSL